MLPRLIPCLLLKNRGFVKTTKFANPVYLGDPYNILKIFNEKEVDELVILDIVATKANGQLDFEYLKDMASECFMPVSYGGGIRDLGTAEKILSIGYEKICLNTAAVKTPGLIKEASAIFGSQSVVVSIDVKRSLFGKYEAVVAGASEKTGLTPEVLAKRAEEMGAGEIFLTSVDRDGTYGGYDLDLVRRVAEAVNIPVVACGGASNITDAAGAVKSAGASAAAAGSMFVFQGPHRAVLVNVPDYGTWKAALN